jgi:hypothetical protein
MQRTNDYPLAPGKRDWWGRRQVRSVFFVGLIPCAFSHALCSACAFVSAAVLGRLAGLPIGVDILITRDIGLAPAGCADKLYQAPERLSCLTEFARSAPARHLAVFAWLATICGRAPVSMIPMGRPFAGFYGSLRPIRCRSGSATGDAAITR